MSEILLTKEQQERNALAEDTHDAAKDAAAQEAARLAAAQAERFAKKEPAANAPVDQVAPPAEPKVVGRIAIVLYENGKANIDMPLKDFDLTLEMIRMLHVAMIQQARAEGVQLESAKKRVPFMKRIFARARPQNRQPS